MLFAFLPQRNLIVQTTIIPEVMIKSLLVQVDSFAPWMCPLSLFLNFKPDLTISLSIKRRQIFF